MKKNFVGHYLLLLALISLLIGTIPLNGNQEKKPGQCIEIELKRIEETYRLLDTFAEEIWPGWNNYNEVEFRVQFPNMVHLLVNPGKTVPEGYKQLQGRTVHGKPIFINREKEFPMKMKPPLTGVGWGGLSIKIQLKQADILPGESETGKEPPENSERHILMYVHETFHGFQHQFELLRILEDESIYDFTSNTGYATYSHIEGLALINAYNEKDNDKALKYLQDYIVAREITQTFMNPKTLITQQSISVNEGTSLYAEVKMAKLIRDKKYKSNISKQDDPFFFDFKFMDDFIEENTTTYIHKKLEATSDTIGKYYAIGAYQCFVLDRFVPGWQRDFFQSKKTQDQVITNFLNLSPEQKKIIARRLKTKYPYDRIYAKHDAVLKERDQAIQLINNRKGTKYILQLFKLREHLYINPRVKEIVISPVDKIFPHGMEDFHLADIQLTTADTPIYRRMVFSYEWIDTETGPGKKGYKMTFKEKAGDTYKNLVFRTKGFTLKAPEAQIKEDKDKNEIRILVLSKVAR